MDSQTKLQDLINFPIKSFFAKSNLSINKKNILDIPKVSAEIANNSVYCYAEQNNYTYDLQLNNFTDSETAIIILSKDNEHVLSYTLEKIKSYDLHDQHDILLVDDRSSSNEILSLANKYKTSYIRIDNNKDIFNYSVLCNIAASYAKFYNKKTLIFWNNDMWPESYDSFRKILSKHKIYKSDITGAKLIYPSKQQYEDLGKPKHYFQQYMDQMYETIQHGGIHFIPIKAPFVDNQRRYLSNEIVLGPDHTWRFNVKDTPMASHDIRCYAVTGALHIIDTNVFFDIGCLNIGLGTSFQDIDLCIRGLMHNKAINYIGSETMIHAESITSAKDNIIKTPEFYSDNILWAVLWGSRLPSILGYQK